MEKGKNKFTHDYIKDRQNSYIFAGCAAVFYIIFAVLSFFGSPLLFSILSWIAAFLFIVSCVVGIVSSKLIKVQKRFEYLEKRVAELEAKIEECDKRIKD